MKAEEVNDNGTTRSQLLRIMFERNAVYAKDVILAVLNRKGSIDEAAATFGVSVGCLRSYMKNYGIETEVRYFARGRRTVKS